MQASVHRPGTTSEQLIAVFKRLAAQVHTIIVKYYRAVRGNIFIVIDGITKFCIVNQVKREEFGGYIVIILPCKSQVYDIPVDKTLYRLAY